MRLVEKCKTSRIRICRIMLILSYILAMGHHCKIQIQIWILMSQNWGHFHTEFSLWPIFNILKSSNTWEHFCPVLQHIQNTLSWKRASHINRDSSNLYPIHWNAGSFKIAASTNTETAKKLITWQRRGTIT